MSDRKFNKIKYNNEFNSNAYDRINLTVKKGNKNKIKEIAELNGGTVNGYIKNAIKKQYKEDAGEEIEL